MRFLCFGNGRSIYDLFSVYVLLYCYVNYFCMYNICVIFYRDNILYIICLIGVVGLVLLYISFFDFSLENIMVK